MAGYRVSLFATFSQTNLLTIVTLLASLANGAISGYEYMPNLCVKGSSIATYQSLSLCQNSCNARSNCLGFESVVIENTPGMPGPPREEYCNLKSHTKHSSSTYGCWNSWFYKKIGNPTRSPTPNPTSRPTHNPTLRPSHAPTDFPTRRPTLNPTSNPSSYPTSSPTATPTLSPTMNPSLNPTESPTAHPITSPTLAPSNTPTGIPTHRPTLNPTLIPSSYPTGSPTVSPTPNPTSRPTPNPTSSPTLNPKLRPSHAATNFPTRRSTSNPSPYTNESSTDTPKYTPTMNSTHNLTKSPTSLPSTNPVLRPWNVPTEIPSKRPTSNITSQSSYQTGSPTVRTITLDPTPCSVNKKGSLRGHFDDGEKDQWVLNQIIKLHDMFYVSNGIVLDLPDGAFTASDEYSENQLAMYSRIGPDKVPGKALAWCGKSGGANEITVDMTSSYLVMGVATQGRGGGHSYWTTEYFVETSENGNDWVRHGKFRGNFDAETICRRRLKKPILASFVKFIVLDYFNTVPCMRLDVLVYSIDEKS